MLRSFMSYMASGEEVGRGSSLSQLVCLFFTLVITLPSSAVRSLALLVRKSKSASRTGIGSCDFYEGRVWHERKHPAVHRFEYQVRYALVDLDAAPDWFRLSGAASNHLTAAEARRIAGSDGAVLLLTIPTSVGYEQNPLSVYYCYDEQWSDNGFCYSRGRLIKCIAEVTNTPWAERVTFSFDPSLDTIPKPLHVSPFMDMLGTWKIRASPPGESLNLVIDVQHPDFGDYFCAVLKAMRVEDVASAELFFLWMPHKVALWIYWHALQLVFKGVSFVSHPKYETGLAYRQDAKQRDKKLRSSLSIASSGCPIDRFCAWREAPYWPWK